MTGGSGFVCRQCGECCRWPGHVWLDDADLTRLAEATGLCVDTFIERYTELTRNRAGLSLVEQPGGACIFLQDGICRVYAARPRQCREFPAQWTVSGGCPGNPDPVNRDP